MVCAGSDGSDAVRQLERVATGWRLKAVAPALIVCARAQTAEAMTERALRNRAIRPAIPATQGTLGSANPRHLIRCLPFPRENTSRSIEPVQIADDFTKPLVAGFIEKDVLMIHKRAAYSEAKDPFSRIRRLMLLAHAAQCASRCLLGYGSSSRATAARLKNFLQSGGATVLDWQPDFIASRSILAKIEEAAARCNAGIFLFTKNDDLADENQAERSAPRDNVVFEAEYFIGLKGKRNVLIIESRARTCGTF